MSKILIVDDDEGVREMCRMVLSTEGYDVVEADSGPGGVNLARKEQPHLVLLDWMMPDVDGMDTLRMLKASQATSGIPVIMLTALDGLPQISLATMNGADGYVVKPFEVDDLLRLVKRFTEQPAATD
ncbi:MAG: response regulator transcription factor [Armatimonadota bacterium]